jgi:hypothetical protein
LVTRMWNFAPPKKQTNIHAQCFFLLCFWHKNGVIFSNYLLSVKFNFYFYFFGWKILPTFFNIIEPTIHCMYIG